MSLGELRQEIEEVIAIQKEGLQAVNLAYTENGQASGPADASLTALDEAVSINTQLCDRLNKSPGPLLEARTLGEIEVALGRVATNLDQASMTGARQISAMDTLIETLSTSHTHATNSYDALREAEDKARTAATRYAEIVGNTREPTTSSELCYQTARLVREFGAVAVRLAGELIDAFQGVKSDAVLSQPTSIILATEASQLQSSMTNLDQSIPQLVDGISDLLADHRTLGGSLQVLRHPLVIYTSDFGSHSQQITKWENVYQVAIENAEGFAERL